MSGNLSRAKRWILFTGLAACAIGAARAHAHGISQSSREAMAEGGLLDFVWLGAEHMVTGYDHLLFLFGVIFFLKSFRDIVRFITAFTLGHCITLLGATLMGITANAWLIDAAIALSVVYKGFENLDGFKRVFKVKVPDLRAMVFVFGLVHGFGLSTRLQELRLGEDGIVARILAFNVGVELGQVAALTVLLGFFALWRSSKTFERFDRSANVLLCLAGSALLAYQLAGYTGFIVDEHADEHADEHGHSDGSHHGNAGHDHGDAGHNHADAGHNHADAGHNHADAGHDHKDAGHDHKDAGHDHKDAGHDHKDAGHDHKDAGHDHKAAGHDHKDAGHDHKAAGHDHKDAGHDHKDAGHDHKDAGHDHADGGHDHADGGHDHADAVEAPQPSTDSHEHESTDSHEHESTDSHEHKHGEHKH